MPDDLDAIILSGTTLLEIPVEPEWHDTIRANLDATLRLARLVDRFPLPDEADAAPVFRA